MTSLRSPFVILALLAGLGSAVSASPTDVPAAVAGVADGIHIDGVLDELAWTTAAPIGPLRQRDPKEGAAASYEWDAIWYARARIVDEGWVAEIAIPFKSLRFKPGQEVWGFNIERQIKRRQEHDTWASSRRDSWITNLEAAGQITGLVGLRQGWGLDIRPFVSGGEEDHSGKFKVGLDVFKSLTASLTASLTVNTDFAETEVDARQINLTRFDLFFPEKRTFFLEGAGVFDTDRCRSSRLSRPFAVRTSRTPVNARRTSLRDSLASRDDSYSSVRFTALT